jgi:hypothetical protein
MNRHFYSTITENPPYSPDSQKAYKNFMAIHPELLKHISGRKRPLQWKILWKIITQHEDGVCERECRDFKDLDNNIDVIQKGLNWLCEHNYLQLSPLSRHWGVSIPQYVLKWGKTEERLKLTRPPEFQPISREQLHRKQSSIGNAEIEDYE